MSKVSRIGIDLSKSVFVVYGVDEREQCCLKRTLKRADVLSFFATLEPCQVAMESGSGAHYWARELIMLGHDARIIDPKLVAPYRHQGRSGKNDTNDAEAICEAMSRPTMRFVPVKSVEQQDIQSAHHIREKLVGRRTAKSNQIRGLVGEYGLVTPAGIGQLRRTLPQRLENGENGLTDDFRALLADLADDLRHLDDRIADLDERIEASVKNDPVARRLLELRGVGPLTASALSGALGDV